MGVSAIRPPSRRIHAIHLLPQNTDAVVAALTRLAGCGPILELGIGTGRIALPFAQRGLSVHGIDASPAMVAQLRKKPGGEHIPVTIGNFADMAVNCIAPGLIEGTRMAQRLPAEIVQLARSQVVLGRVASVQDIAEQVVTFCRAESITGQVLVIDGGMPGSMR
jgi:SAM-dependent methyltransferase